MPDPRRGVEGEKGTREVRGKRAPLCGQRRACACRHMEALCDRTEACQPRRSISCRRQAWCQFFKELEIGASGGLASTALVSAGFTEQRRRSLCWVLELIQSAAFPQCTGATAASMALTDMATAIPPLAILPPSSVARNVDTDLICQAFASRCTSREMQREQDEVEVA